MHEKEKNLLIAILSALAAALCNTMMIALFKVGAQRGETIPMVLFWRSGWFRGRSSTTSTTQKTLS